MEHEQRTMSMWLQTLPLKFLSMIYIAGAALFAISLIIGATGPSIYSRSTYSSWECANSLQTVFDVSNCTGVDIAVPGQQWDGVLRNMNKLNQQLRLIVTPGNSWDEGIEIGITFTIMIVGRMTGNTESVMILNTNRTHTIDCPKDTLWCKDVLLVQLPWIEYNEYEFRIGLANAPQTGWVHDFHFTYEFTNSSYTIFELWFRFVFLCSTIAMIAWQTLKLRQFKWSDWGIEQQWTAILLFGLLGYNNPFYPATILFHTWFWIFVNELLSSTFVILLLFYWLIVFDEARNEAQGRSRFVFYIPKAAFLGSCWLITIILITWAKLSLVSNPTAEAVKGLTSYLFVTAAMLVLVILYAFWVVYLVFRSCGDIRGMNFLGSRIKFFAVFTLVCMAAVIVNYTASFLSPYMNNAARFLSSISMANLYLYVLTLMYFPSADGAKASKYDRRGMTRLADSGASGSIQMDHLGEERP